MMQFRPLAIVTTLLFAALAIIWMFLPATALSGWGVPFTESAGLVSRRAAAFYAGIAVMFWRARNAPPSEGRAALVAGLITACLLIAALGLFELTMGRTNNGIFLAVTIELLVATAFLLSGRKAP